jgi:hypothetical protein
MAWRKLNIPRTDKALIITVISKKREEILKRRLYKELTEELAKSISIAPSDVVVGIIENSVADWSFGNGEPQFLTGALGSSGWMKRNFTIRRRANTSFRRNVRS